MGSVSAPVLDRDPDSAAPAFAPTEDWSAPRRRRARLVVAALVLLVGVGVAVFATVAGGEPTRAERLAQQLRCPGCGPVLADADGDTADGIRRLIDQQLAAGWTDQMVLDDFASRYGSWIVREPPPADRPWRWAFPVTAVVLGAAVAALAPGRLVPSAGRGRLGAQLGGGALVVVGCLGVGVLLVGDAPDEAPPAITTEDAGLTVDPNDVSDAELEAVVEQNPGIVPMRLALVERYLEAGDVEAAHVHTAIAIDLDAAPADRQRALKYHGWTTALLGDAQAGADLLESSLLLAPEDRDAKWFLANVRFHGLGQDDAALGILEDLVETPMDDAQRRLVEAKLAEIRQAG